MSFLPTFLQNKIHLVYHATLVMYYNFWHLTDRKLKTCLSIFCELGVSNQLISLFDVSILKISSRSDNFLALKNTVLFVTNAPSLIQGVSQDLKVARPKLYRNCENIWCTQSVHGERLGAKPITGGVQGPALGPWWGSRGRSPRKLWAFPLKMIEVLMHFGQNKAPILTVGITEYDHKCHETWTSLAFPTSSRPENVQSLCFGSYLKSTKKHWCTDLHSRPELM